MMMSSLSENFSEKYRYSRDGGKACFPAGYLRQCWKITFILCFCILKNTLILEVWSEETNALTLNQAVREAIQNNPGLQAKRAEMAVREAEIVTAGARLNPAIISDNGVAEKTYRLGVEQTLRLGGKRRRQIELAQSGREVLRAEIQTVIQNLRNEVRQAYTRLFIAQQRLLVAEQITGSTQRLMIVVEQRESSGDIPSLAFQHAKLAFLQAKNNAYLAFGEVVTARANLNVLLNKPLSNYWEISSPSTVQPEKEQIFEALNAHELILHGDILVQQTTLDRLIQMALAIRSEIQENLMEITVVERQLALAKANRVPDVTLTAGPDLVAEPLQRELNVFVVVNVPVPLFNRQQGPILEARAQKIQLEALQRALKNQIALEVTTAYTRFTVNRQRLHQYEIELLPTAENVLRLSQKSFEFGKSSILIPLTAQESYLQTRMSYLALVEDYQNAISDLERAVGSPL